MSVIDIGVEAILEEAVGGASGPETFHFFRHEERNKKLAARARDLSREQQAELVVKAACRGAKHETAYVTLQPLMSSVLRRNLEFSEAQVLEILASLEKWQFGGPLLPVLTAVGRRPMTADIAKALRRLRSHSWLQSGYAQAGELNDRLDQLLGLKEEEDEGFRPFGSWSKRVEESLHSNAKAQAIRNLLQSGKDIRGANATKKWRTAAADIVEQIGPQEFRALALGWLALGPDPEPDGLPVVSEEADFQRGLLWALTNYSDREICSAVAAFAEQCLKKIPNFGPVSEKAGNACINVLANMSGDESLGQLARLGIRIKYQTAQRLINRALQEAAERAGLSREELEEITVPDFGLDPAGKVRENIGTYEAEFSTSEPTVQYRNPDGKTVKSLPPTVREEYADAIKRIRRGAKDVDAMLTAQRLRIERLLMADRTITLATWRKHYLEHPLLSVLTRRLIWRFQWNGSDCTAIPGEGGLVEWSGQTVDPPEDCRVQLWHPIDSDVQTVFSWRCWLEDQKVRQPFKQAHREVYIITDAERDSADHSNRFAAHILRQHQFAALAHARGWRFTLMGTWDSHNTPYLDLPAVGLQVQFSVNDGGMEDQTDHGVYLYLTTDRVRFMKPESRTAVELTEVPVRLLSEVMRDVDLFVSVTSVGSDPNWVPGQFAQLDAYWESFSFGELSVSAQSRRETIERLLPRLPIADRCRLEDRFLIVSGQLATYKIHLGSGNVLMEPGSRYLCIVQGPSTGKTPSRVFLPFEGDSRLALILSKAFLLAHDSKIKDASILRQLPS